MKLRNVPTLLGSFVSEIITRLFAKGIAKQRCGIRETLKPLLQHVVRCHRKQFLCRWKGHVFTQKKKKWRRAAFFYCLQNDYRAILRENNTNMTLIAIKCVCTMRNIVKAEERTIRRFIKGDEQHCQKAVERRRQISPHSSSCGCRRIPR